MPTVKADAVKRLFQNNGFTYSFGIEGSVFRYDAGGLGLSFPAPWLKSDLLQEYDLMQVRKVLNGMVESARSEKKVREYLSSQDNVDMLTHALMDFGMVYDEDDAQFYYVRDGKAVFGVDLDYIASLVCTGKASEDKLGETLGDMLETAEYEALNSGRARNLENGIKA